MPIGKSDAHGWHHARGIAIPVVAQVCLVLYGWYFMAGMAHLLLLHAIFAVFVIAAGVVWFRRGGSSASITLYIISSVTLGPVGTLGCALMELVRWMSRRSSMSFEDWYQNLFPHTVAEATQSLYELLEWRGGKPGRESTVAPFRDVLDQGSVTQKQVVITLIADNFRPEFADALQRALRDPEPAIRVQGATAAARIENQFLQKSVLLKEAAKACPRDPSVARTIALHHKSYAQSGLLDPERAASERRHALAISMTLLQGSPCDPNLTAAVTRLLLELDRPQEAMGFLHPWLRAKSIPPALVGPIADTLYRLHRLRLLRRVSSRLLASLTPDATDEPLRATLRLWAYADG